MYTRYVIRDFSNKNLKHILFFRLLLYSYYSIFVELLKNVMRTYVLFPSI